jgi:cytochrome c oxidase subunit IV
MVSTVGLFVLVVMVLVNAALAAVLTRLLRVRLTTTWGTVVYVALVVPVVLLISTILMGAVAGPTLGSRAAVIGLLVVVPFALGVSFDVLWMPAPDEVELPAPADEE